MLQRFVPKRTSSRLGNLVLSSSAEGERLKLRHAAGQLLDEIVWIHETIGTSDEDMKSQTL